ncbi:reverse transcriptase/maturase family protein [Streptomyces sp. NBC_01285]|nr:reverse transcriptase/maturase family protein [Streptomyces sp. NBC_01285]
MQNAETVLGVLRERGRRGLPRDELYRQLFNPQLYLLAYGRLYSNKGAMTPGVTGETVDGMSLGKIEHVIDALRHERYRWSPARRVYIPKGRDSTKLRPLGLPPWSDKLVGEVVRLLLEAYYEPTFSDSSHGFRPRRGCHTALEDVAYTWTGTAWFIEGDIAQCFDRLDHSVMLGILGEKIHDNRFLRLVRNMLTAGYMEDWVWNATHSGSPQGGVVSPILSNIYLHKMDEYVEKVLIPEYTRGRVRKPNRAFHRVWAAIGRARKRGDHIQVRELRKQLHSIPSMDTHDPGYRRLRYVRYADDTLLGFAGPKAEAEEIKERLARFLHDDLKLELSPEKTLITHARTGGEVPRLQHHRAPQRPEGLRQTPLCQWDHRSAYPPFGGNCQAGPVHEARQTRATTRTAEPGRPRHHQHLRVGVPGHRPVLPAGRRRLFDSPGCNGSWRPRC